MKPKEQIFKTGNPRPIRGRQIIAKSYLELNDEDYRDNPLIEVLPTEWDWSQQEIYDKLGYYPSVPENVAGLSDLARLKILMNFKLKFFQVFNRHRYIEENISLLIRSGYIGRNPINPRFRRNLRDHVDGLLDECESDLPPIIPASSLGFALLAAPGSGKTTTLGNIFRLYPQVVQHQNYRRDVTFCDKQVVWLFLNCPHDSSTRGLCLQFLGELDAILGEDYYDKYQGENENALIQVMSTLAALHHLGALVIDEIQSLNPAKSGGKSELLKFIVQLQNAIGIPVVFAGTHAAKSIVAGGPHEARRAVGVGGASWDCFRQLDEEWKFFLESLSAGQVLEHKISFDGKIAEVIYDETQGNVCYAVDLMFLAQREALINGSKELTVDGLKWAAENRMQYCRPYINAMRSNNPLAARLLEDIRSPDYEDFETFAERDLLLPSKVQKVTIAKKNNVKGTKPNVKALTTEDALETSNDSVPPIHPPAPKEPIIGPLPQQSRSRSKKINHPAGTLMAICAEAHQKGVNPWDGLTAAGFMRPANEFFPCAPTSC